MTASSSRPCATQDQIQEGDSGIVMTKRDLHNFQRLLLTIVSEGTYAVGVSNLGYKPITKPIAWRRFRRQPNDHYVRMALADDEGGCFRKKANASGDDDRAFDAVKETTHQTVFKTGQAMEFEETVKTYRIRAREGP